MNCLLSNQRARVLIRWPILIVQNTAKKNSFQIAGKINYHEQLIVASKNTGSLDDGDRKVRDGRSRC